MNCKKTILVTGCHRSGSTWVGKTIAYNPNIFYLGEPFNPSISYFSSCCPHNFKYWFEYINQNNQQMYYQSISKMVNLSYDWNIFAKSVKNIKDLRNYLSLYKKIIKHKLVPSRLLIKDPIAVFSSKWLAETFDMRVVVTIRHPVAFVGSLKKADHWRFHYQNFLEQPLLMNDYLLPWKDQIHEYAQRKPTRVEHGILFWNIVHSILHQYKQQHPDWIFVRHEDLSMDPVNQFQELFSQLEVKYTEPIKQKIISSTNNQVQDDKNIATMELNRNSLNNLLSFNKRLSQEEIVRIKEETNSVCQLFYPEEKWNLLYK